MGAHRHDSCSVPPTFSNRVYALLSFFYTEPARSVVFTFLVFLSTPFATQLNKLGSTVYMNAFFSSGDTTCARPLVFTLDIIQH